MTGPTRDVVERHPHWAVTVAASGEHIVTLETECYGGRDPSPADEDAISTAAHHLLSFIGDDTPDALRAKLEAAEAERDAAINALSEAAAARGRAEGRLAASEMAGVLDGWKQRAEAAEAALTAALDDVRRQERAAGRKAGLEEAAKVADHYAEMDYCAIGYPEDGGIAASGTADTIRRDIRALAEQGGET